VEGASGRVDDHRGNTREAVSARLLDDDHLIAVESRVVGIAAWCGGPDESDSAHQTVESE
jgi:hypothetical protein